jgi:hypothetical protein
MEEYGGPSALRYIKTAIPLCKYRAGVTSEINLCWSNLRCRALSLCARRVVPAAEGCTRGATAAGGSRGAQQDGPEVVVYSIYCYAIVVFFDSKAAQLHSKLEASRMWRIDGTSKILRRGDQQHAERVVQSDPSRCVSVWR